MSDMNIQAVLQQIRQVSALSEGLQSEGPKTTEAEASQFSGLLKQSIEGVNQQQKQASELATAWQLGDPSVDLPQVMIAAEKASVSFEAAKQVRNKLIEAYQDIMKMPI